MRGKALPYNFQLAHEKGPPKRRAFSLAVIDPMGINGFSRFGIRPLDGVLDFEDAIAIGVMGGAEVFSEPAIVAHGHHSIVVTVEGDHVA